MVPQVPLKPNQQDYAAKIMAFLERRVGVYYSIPALADHIGIDHSNLYRNLPVIQEAYPQIERAWGKGLFLRPTISA